MRECQYCVDVVTRAVQGHGIHHGIHHALHHIGGGPGGGMITLAVPMSTFKVGIHSSKDLHKLITAITPGDVTSYSKGVTHDRLLGKK